MHASNLDSSHRRTNRCNNNKEMDRSTMEQWENQEAVIWSVSHSDRHLPRDIMFIQMRRESWQADVRWTVLRNTPQTNNHWSKQTNWLLNFLQEGLPVIDREAWRIKQLVLYFKIVGSCVFLAAAQGKQTKKQNKVANWSSCKVYHCGNIQWYLWKGGGVSV